MVLDEALLKIRTPNRLFVQSESLLLKEEISVQASLDIGDYIQRSFFLFGFPEFTFHLLRFCDRHTCFFDIGANAGLISCGVSRCVSHDHIHAFEPVPSNLEMLRTNFSKNCPAAHAYEFALSDKIGGFEMVVLSHDSGSASLETQYRTKRTKDIGIPCQIDSINVRLLTFDAFIVQNSLQFAGLSKAAFKIDVEGHEMPVLMGMDGFLRKHGTQLEVLIVVEAHRQNFDEVQLFLKGHGFKQIWPDERTVTSFLARKVGAIDLIFHRYPQSD